MADSLGQKIKRIAEALLWGIATAVAAGTVIAIMSSYWNRIGLEDAIVMAIIAGLLASSLVFFLKTTPQAMASALFLMIFSLPIFYRTLPDLVHPYLSPKKHLMMPRMQEELAYTVMKEYVTGKGTHTRNINPINVVTELHDQQIHRWFKIRNDWVMHVGDKAVVLPRHKLKEGESLMSFQIATSSLIGQTPTLAFEFYVGEDGKIRQTNIAPTSLNSPVFEDDWLQLDTSKIKFMHPNWTDVLLVLLGFFLIFRIITYLRATQYDWEKEPINS